VWITCSCGARIDRPVNAAFGEGGAPRQPTPDAFTVGSALSDTCAVCGERATNIRYKHADGALAFHKRCEDIWRDEADKPIRRG